MVRARRVPFPRSRPSLPLPVATLGVVAAGIALPLSPLAHPLGFTAPPPSFFFALTGMVVAYLVLVELAKKVSYAFPKGGGPAVRRRGHAHHVQRRASRFSRTGPLPGGAARP
ncbi:hypothetical protein ACFYY8_24450 [Streptosporangium sp. NPDC001559]|uniref:hypothetical protein n=1 Tax=Streptosporangium sp. NPDC001559 TaxID=3366187 RepID=UPI0036EA27E8